MRGFEPADPKRVHRAVIQGGRTIVWALPITSGPGWKRRKADNLTCRLCRGRGRYGVASGIFEMLPDDGIHLSHALTQLAAIALATGRDDQAILLAERAMPLANLAENASLLATLQLIKAAALDREGHSAEARALRLDSLPAARYGFGAEPEVRARAAEIAVLAGLNTPG